MAKKRDDDAPPGAPEWLVTFSDLVSLLVTLFIMMLTFSTQEKDKMNVVIHLLKGGFGILSDEIREKPAIAENPIEWNVARFGVMVPELDLPPDLETFVKELEGFFLDKSDLDEGARIVPETGTCFAPGDDRPSAEFEQELRRLARGLKRHAGRRIRVEGFADEESDRRNPLGDVTFLSLARARKTARILGLEGVQLEQMIVSGRGTIEPRGDRWSEEGQARNRRVEIVVLPAPRKKGDGREKR